MDQLVGKLFRIGQNYLASRIFGMISFVPLD
jgi:hypothetical protein